MGFRRDVLEYQISCPYGKIYCTSIDNVKALVDRFPDVHFIIIEKSEIIFES